MTGCAGTSAQAIFRQVGSTSMVPATAPHTLPGAILPGHHASVGTRTPPSQVVPLPPRKGPALPPSGPLMSQGPLSLVKMTSVFVSSCSSRSVSNTRPTLASTSCTQSPKRPFCELPWKALPGWMGVCTAVCGK